MRAVIIPADRDQPVQVKDIAEDQLQGLVGGYVEVVGLGSLNAVMTMDEDAALKPKSKANTRATYVVRSRRGAGYTVLGDVVVLGPPAGDKSSDLSEEAISDLDRVIGPVTR